MFYNILWKLQKNIFLENKKNILCCWWVLKRRKDLSKFRTNWKTKQSSSRLVYDVTGVDKINNIIYFCSGLQTTLLDSIKRPVRQLKHFISTGKVMCLLIVHHFIILHPYRNIFKNANQRSKNPFYTILLNNVP